MWTAIGICVILFIVSILIGAIFSFTAIALGWWTNISYESYIRLLRIAENINYTSLVFLIVGLLIFIYWIIGAYYV